MANKTRLQGLITPPRNVPAVPEAPAPGPVYPIGPIPQPADLALPPQAGALSVPLQDIARRFIGARRRSGEALLEAARWLQEARTLAKHGEWGIFLEATGTSDDAAERLLNIHSLAMSDQRFADAVARNWLSQSVAADLARPSTPPEALEAVLEAEQPPTRAVTQRAIKQARAGQNPHSADSEANGAGQNPHSADSLSDHRPGETQQEVVGGDGLQQLQEAAAMLTALARRASELPASAATEDALQAIEIALTHIRSALHR